MTLSDEEHLKKLQKGALNFQRVAFDQRMQKGRSLQLKHSFNIRSPEEKDEDEQKDNFNDDYGIHYEDGFNENVSSPEISKDTTSAVTELVHDTVQTDFDQPTCSKYITGENSCIPTSLSITKNDSRESHKSAKVDDCNIPEDSSESGVKIGTKRKGVKFDVISGTSSTCKRGRINASKLKSTVSSVLTYENRLRGHLQQSISLCSGKLQCSYSGLASSKSLIKENITNSSMTGVKRRSVFTYTSEQKRNRYATDNNISTLKEGGLHASRTSLRMHRSVTDEKLIPTNAMNTHDALVMNPMPIRVHLHTTPFKSFFTRSKVKLTEEEQALWKRNRVDIGNGNEISMDHMKFEEYFELLKDQLKYSEEVLQNHEKIIDKVKSCGPVGITIRTFKVTICNKYFFENPHFIV